MEKTISLEERMKRAEEIYYRRKLKNGNVRMPSSQVTERVEKRQISLYKKMILQILICILIYLIFSIIKEANYLFSENIMNKTKEFLSTDINFEIVSQQVSQFFQDNISNWLNTDNTVQENNEIVQDTENKIIQNEEVNSTTVQNEENNSTTTQNEQGNNVITQNTETQTNINSENSDNQNTAQTSQNNQATGIGGTNEETVTTSASEGTKKTQMQIDAEYIKNNFSIQIPAKGEITSHYGKREATEIISENHRGIDIGVVVGTTIVASMEGKVSIVSNEGDYGTHVKIVNKDVTTVYAHCSKILVKEGDTVKKGQKIALSGNTGNTTGPHLHFEIQRSERTVDPELILSWT